jgi:FkbM family methyltransferase
MEPYKISYAQNKEDILIDGFLKGVGQGFYVDVGASDPVHLSVTKYFYDKGWSGINIEPIPDLYDKLTKARPRDINLAISVGEKRTEAKLHYYPNGNGLSTISNEMAAEHKNKQNQYTQDEKILTVKMLPLKDVLEQYAKGKIINFMKIDVEGYEAQVIKGNNWAKYRPQLICIEAEHIFNRWEDKLLEQKYKKVFFDGLNNYYLAEEVADKSKTFSYSNTILDKPVLYHTFAEKLEDNRKEIQAFEQPARLYDKVLFLKNQKEQKEKIIVQRNFEIQRLNFEIQRLNFEIQRPKSIKRAIRIVARAINYKILDLIERLKPTAAIQIPNNCIIGAEKLLQEIQVYDKKNEVILNAGFSIRLLPYMFIGGIYGLLLRACKKGGRFLKRFIHGTVK